MTSLVNSSLAPSSPSSENARQAPVTPAHRAPHIDRSKVDPEILQAAEGMEAMFLDYMLKVMRETVPKNDMDLESPATGIYRSMLDSQFAEKAAHQGGIGLAEPIIDYLQSRSYHGRMEQGVPGNVQGKAPINAAEDFQDKEKP
jgi:Rod binding domain-containing protein